MTQPLLHVDPTQSAETPATEVGHDLDPQRRLVAANRARCPFALFDGRPPSPGPLLEGHLGHLGVEILIGVELVAHVALEALGVGLALESAFSRQRIAVADDPDALVFVDPLVDAHSDAP